MSLDKAILHGKEKRKPYRGAKSVDPSCRNHGDCPFCHANRLYGSKKREEAQRQQLREYFRGQDEPSRTENRKA